MPLSTPSLSIITISKDNPEGLRATLDSIVAQTVRPLEVILVRAGSSLEVDVGFMSRIGLPVSDVTDPGHGISAAFNQGLTTAKGDWIQFLNGGDCLLDASALARLREAIAAAPPGTDLVSGFSRTTSGGLIPHAAPRSQSDYLYLSHQATVISRNSVNRVGLFDLSFRIRMDLDWLGRYLRLRSRQHIAFVNDYFVLYADGGVSSRNIIRFYFEELRVLLRHRMFLDALLVLLVLRIPYRLFKLLVRV